MHLLLCFPSIVVNTVFLLYKILNGSTVGEICMRSYEYYFGVYSPRRESPREINTHITSPWADKLSATIVHTLVLSSHEHKSQVKTLLHFIKTKKVALDPQYGLLQYCKRYEYDINWWIILNIYECPFTNTTHQYTCSRNTIHQKFFAKKLPIWKSNDHAYGKWITQGSVN